MRYVVPVISGLFLVSPAWGQTVDAQGADRLSQSIARYLGKEAVTNGLLKITPEGDAYRIVVDVMAAMKLLPAESGVEFRIDPTPMLAKPVGGGKWEITQDIETSTGAFSLTSPEVSASWEWALSQVSASGIFDEALSTFASMTMSVDAMTMSSQDSSQTMQANIGRTEAEMTGVANPGGGVNINYAQTARDFREKIDTILPANQQVLSVMLTADKVETAIDWQGFRVKEMLDLLAFVVAHPEKQQLTANQDQLRDRLRAVLPLWNTLDGSYRFDNLNVETPVGPFRLASATVDATMTGMTQNGALSYRLGASGLGLPDAVPAWSAVVAPTEIDFNIEATGIDLEKIAKKIVDDFDLNREEIVPVDTFNSISADVMANPPKIVISRSTLKNDDSEMTMEGEVTFQQTKPEINVTLEFSGFDGVVEKLNGVAKNDPLVQNILPGIMAVKGFARTLPDGRLQWQVAVKPDGTAIVNGVMVKGPK